MWFQELIKESWVAKNAPQQNIIVNCGDTVTNVVRSLHINYHQSN